MFARRLFITVLMIIAASITLWWISRQERQFNNVRHGFNRVFLLPAVQTVKIVSLQERISSIVGVKDGLIYLATPRTGEWFAVDSFLKISRKLSLSIPKDDTTRYGMLNTIDPPLFQIYNGSMRKVITGKLNHQGISTAAIPSGYFSNIARISADEFVIRTVDTPGLQAVFKKVVLHGEQATVSPGTDVTPDSHDAGLSSDGWLHYDAVNRKLIFVEFYAHHIFCLDTSLRLTGSFHTVDTFSSPRAIVTHTATSASFSEPPTFINKRSDVAGGRLYVQSTVKADNESATFFEQDVIDVYDINQQKYLGSFCLPRPGKSRLQHLKVLEHDQLLAVYLGYIARYRIPY